MFNCEPALHIERTKFQNSSHYSFFILKVQDPTFLVQLVVWLSCQQSESDGPRV